MKAKPAERQKFIIEPLAWKTAPSAVLLLSLALTGLAWYYATNTVRRDAEIGFARQVSEATNSLDFRIQTYINTLRASQALFAASESVERNEWKTFAQSLNLRSLYPGINGIGFIRYVPHSRKAAYEQQVRQDTTVDPKGYPNFAIKPTGDRPAYFVIEYIEPFSLNRPAMGLDVGGDSVRGAAVVRARDTGVAAATGRITLVQDATKKPGFLIMLPVYRHQMPHNTVAEKRRALFGFVYAPFRTIDLIEESLPDVFKQDLHLEVYNGKDLIYDSDPSKKVAQRKSPLRQIKTLNVAGENWQLHFSCVQTTQAFWSPVSLLVLAGGTLISLLIFGIMRSSNSSRRRALQLATAMTAELTKANADLKTEITERKRVEEELTATTSLQNAILDSANYTIISTTVDGTILTFNTAAERWLGYTASEVVGKTTPAIIHDVDEVVQQAQELSVELGSPIEPGFEVFVAKARLGKSDEREWTYIRKDGTRFPVLLSVTALYDAQKNLTGFLGIGSNIAERKQAEVALRQSEERYRSLVEDQTELIARFDLDGRLTFVNQAYCRYFGMKQEHLIGKNFQDFVVLEDREELARHFDSLILDNPIETIEYRVMVNGQVRYLQWSDRIIFDEKGKFFEFQAVGQDISERISTEVALRESERRFRAIFNSMFQFIGLLKPDGTLLEANQTALDFAGVSADEVIGRPFWEARWWTISTRTQEKLKKAISEAANGQFIRYEVDLLGSGTKVTTIDFSLKPVFNEWGAVVLLIPEGRDITEKKQAEAEIAASLTEKEVLLKEIHHRVKNNLQVICSLLNLQARSLKDATITALFKETQNRVRSMALVHEKLYQSNNLAKIELGEYLRDLANNLSRSYPIDSSKVIFKTDIQSNIFLDIDVAIPCGLIVNELISNALKYAFKSEEKGEIFLQAGMNEEDKLILLVEDNGRGFPDNFELEKSQTLGLKLVKTLTNQLRGELELDSSFGTKFKILLNKIDR